MLRITTLVATLALITGWAPGEAKGTITHQSKSGKVVVTVTHAFLVSGPDAVTGKPIRRVVLATSDVSGALKACERMMCADGGIEEGMTIDFDAPPRLNYWFVANGQRVQHSGTADPQTVTLTTDTPQRIAGSWTLDATSSGGPSIKVQFDAELVKTIKGR